MRLCLLSFLFACCSPGFGNNLQISINHDGIHKILQELKSWQINNLDHSYHMADYQTDTRFAKISLQDAHVKKLEIGNMELNFDAQDSAVLTMSDVNLVSGGNWSYKAFVIEAKGSVVATISEATIDLWYIRPIEIAGLPYIEPTLNCSVTLKDIDFDFQGPLGDLYNMLTPLFKKFYDIQSQEIICSETVRLLDGFLKDSLEKMRVTFDVFGEIIEYPLSDAPTFTEASGVELSYYGQIMSPNPEESHLKPDATPVFASTEHLNQTKPFRFALHQYFINTIFERIFQENQLQMIVSAQNFPKLAQNLATTCQQFCLGATLPELSTKYPNSTVIIALKMTRKPWFKIEDSAVELHVTGSLNFHVQKPDTNLTDHLFSVSASTVYSADLQVSRRGDLTIVALDDTHLSVKEVTNSQHFPTKIPHPQLLGILNGMQTAVLRPTLEEIARNTTIPLPRFVGNSFKNVSITALIRTLIIDADIE